MAASLLKVKEKAVAQKVLLPGNHPLAVRIRYVVQLMIAKGCVNISVQGLHWLDRQLTQIEEGLSC